MPLAVPTPAQEVPGNYVTSALWNANVYNGLTFLLNPPVFIGYQTVAQSLTAATWSSLLLDTESVDTYNGHSTSTNTSRYTPTVPGYYLVIGTVGWAGNATGYRRVRIALNGNGIVGSGSEAMAGDTAVTANATSTVVFCNGSTDYIEVQGSQNSSGSLQTNPNADFCASMRVIWQHV